MQQTILKYFEQLSSFPHCSGKTEALRTFLIHFAQELGYEVQVDKLQNILIQRGSPRLALQAHYDMVCMGRAPEIETYEKEGWLHATESSLGADNGMAIAMMMVLMRRKEELAFVLTSDEEVGLIGASGMDLPLETEFMLNLDYEDEGIVCIGCAGGADLIGNQTFSVASPLKYHYALEVSGLVGGHSGVEIDKGIPNAIKCMANYLADKNVRLAWASGGERRNSIPTAMQVHLSSAEPLHGDEWVKVRPIAPLDVVYESGALIEFLAGFNHGVQAYNETFHLPQSSINLAMVHFEGGQAVVECSSRSMSDADLEALNRRYLDFFRSHGFEANVAYKYPAWTPEINPFTKLVNESMRRCFGASHYEAIHAGLECGVLQARYPKIKFASIGPTIVSPHSTHERVKISSIVQTFKVIETVMERVAKL